MAKASKEIHLKDYKKPNYIISVVHLRVEIKSVEEVYVRSTLWAKRGDDNILGKEPLVLSGEQMELCKVKLEGHELSPDEYQVTDTELIIPDTPSHFELTTWVKINPKANLALEGLYLAGGVLCTQCEAEGFRKITYFVDRPDVMAKYKTTLVADKKQFPVLLSNGNKVDEGKLEDGNYFATFEDPFPKPSYLFAIVAGDLAVVEDEFVTRSEKKVKLGIYVEHGNEDKCEQAMESLKNSMKWDEETFGLECDLDHYNVVAVDAFNSGAMENKGLNIFNSQYVLAKPETATDTDYQNIEGVIGHEYFHNWTGNRVTCRDWFQLTLKEGLTVFRDQEFSSAMQDCSVKRIQDVRILRDYQFPEDAGPNAHPIRPKTYLQIRNFYTATVYNKGAEVIRMVYTLIGDEAFKKGITKYFELYDGQAVTTDDFLFAMEQASGADLSGIRNSWYEQAGTPHVKVTDAYDESTGTYSLYVNQEPSKHVQLENPQPFTFPLSVGLLSAEGESLEPVLDGEGAGKCTQVLPVSGTMQTFVFKNVPSKPIPSLLRNFSAPVDLEYAYSEEELAVLMGADQDDFCRYDAGQRLATLVLNRLIETFQKNEEPQPEPLFLEAFGKLIVDGSIKPAFKAEAILLPSLSGLTEPMEICDFESAFKAREWLMTQIAEAHEKALKELYAALKPEGDFSITSEEMGRRALRNRVLGYLTQLEKKEFEDAAYHQFQNSNNMTDELAAFVCLVNSKSEKKKDVLDAFYQKWKSEFLVINKWIAVQASSKEGNVLAEVQALSQHEAFDAKNPNMLRALYGVFARNLTHFHAVDGSGYQYIADKIIEINDFNPSIAARMMPVFNKYKNLDENRKALMQSELERILNYPKLSPDVYEMVSKILGVEAKVS